MCFFFKFDCLIHEIEDSPTKTMQNKPVEAKFFEFLSYNAGITHSQCYSYQIQDFQQHVVWEHDHFRKLGTFAKLTWILVKSESTSLMTTSGRYEHQVRIQQGTEIYLNVMWI